MQLVRLVPLQLRSMRREEPSTRIFQVCISTLCDVGWRTHLTLALTLFIPQNTSPKHLGISILDDHLSITRGDPNMTLLEVNWMLGTIEERPLVQPLKSTAKELARTVVP
jgi:hypothetical protein